MSATKAAIEDRPSPINCVLVAGGKYHDIDFARLELLKLLAEEPRFRVRVLEDYEDTAAITAADCLISYTCDFVPSLPAQEALRDWLEAGGRWYALHGTNSILRLLKNGLWDSPRAAPLFMELLGSQFISHPPIAPYRVTVANADHPLVSGVEAFETDCELYHLETHGELEVLLETQCDEPAADFVEGDGAVGTHPVCYIKQRGAGAVLYLTIGHCRGHYDLRPLMDWWPNVDRGAWKVPVYYELLRRGIRWLKREL